MGWPHELSASTVYVLCCPPLHVQVVSMAGKDLCAMFRLRLHIIGIVRRMTAVHKRRRLMTLVCFGLWVSLGGGGRVCTSPWWVARQLTEVTMQV